MRKIIILALLLLLLAACQDNGDSSSNNNNRGNNTTTEQTEDGIAAQDSPRVETTPDPGLPATYTPEPMIHSGHLYAVGGFGTRVIHVVQPGDTLAKLCARYGVSVEDIARANRLSNWDHIEVGMALVVPLPLE